MTVRSRGAGSSTAAKWARRVKRLEQSGLSIRTFAAREGVPAGSLSFWKWKLAQQGGLDSRTRTGRQAPLRFVELKTAPVPAVGSVTASTFEVVLGSGRTVRVPGGFDAAELVRLVGVLEEARS